jgi:hypothetical protein
VAEDLAGLFAVGWKVELGIYEYGYLANETAPFL